MLELSSLNGVGITCCQGPHRYVILVSLMDIFPEEGVLIIQNTGI